MSDTSTPVTPDTTVSPVDTATPVTTDKELKNTETIASPVTTESKTKTDLEILDDTNSLCNTVLYCLTKGFYPGADAHLVNQSKEFVKAIKLDIENRRKQVLANGQTTETK